MWNLSISTFLKTTDQSETEYTVALYKINLNLKCINFHHRMCLVQLEIYIYTTLVKTHEVMSNPGRVKRKCQQDSTFGSPVQEDIVLVCQPAITRLDCELRNQLFLYTQIMLRYFLTMSQLLSSISLQIPNSQSLLIMDAA